MGPGGYSWVEYYGCQGCSGTFVNPWTWSGKSQEDEKNLLVVPLVKLALANEWITQEEAVVYYKLKFEPLIWVIAKACASKGGNQELIVNVSQTLLSPE